MQLVYRKDREEILKHFTQVSDSVGTRLAQSQQALASNIGYQTAPHEQERIGGYNALPPQSYSMAPPPQGEYICRRVEFFFRLVQLSRFSRLVNCHCT